MGEGGDAVNDTEKLLAEMSSALQWAKEQLAAVTKNLSDLFVEYSNLKINHSAVAAERDALQKTTLRLMDEKIATEKERDASQQEARILRTALEKCNACLDWFSRNKPDDMGCDDEEAMKLAVAALAATPAPVHKDTERLDVLEICAKALRDCEAMVKNEIMACEFAKTSANAWPDLLTGCVSGGGIQSAIAAIDAELARTKGDK